MYLSMKFSVVCTLLSATLAAPSFQNISGDSTVLARRGNSIGSGDQGGHVSDESESVSVSTIGDSAFSGKGNTFSAVSNIVMGPTRDALFRRGIIEGLGLLGANGNSNEDSSQTNNVIALGNQQLSGQNIVNNPVATIGGMNANMPIQA